MSDTICLIDGDMLAYYSCPYDRIRVEGQEGTLVEDSNGDTYVEFSKEEDEAYLSICIENFKGLLDKIQENTFATERWVAIKGENNYRDKIHLKYKQHSSRTNSSKRSPVSRFVPPLLEAIATEGLAVRAHGMEADDLLRIWHGECLTNGDLPIIVSDDKDLRCIAGKHFSPRRMELYTVDELSALKLFYKQLLMGDPTDNIPGIRKLGPKTAEKIIDPLDNEKDMQLAVISEYLVHYGDKATGTVTLKGVSKESLIVETEGLSDGENESIVLDFDDSNESHLVVFVTAEESCLGKSVFLVNEGTGEDLCKIDLDMPEWYRQLEFTGKLIYILETSESEFSIADWG